MSPIKVLFLGTSYFARTCLENLVQSSLFKVHSVWTRPDAPAGRGLLSKASPVKEFCLQKDVACFTPQTFPKPENPLVQNLDIDGVVVVAYGKMIPSYFLKKFKTVNVHLSLLPRWRGASPVPYALLHGDSKTGVSLQELTSRLDAGDIIKQIEIPLSSSIDSKEVFKKMEMEAIKLLLETFPLYLKNKIKTQKQNEAFATYAPKIKNLDLKINWNQKASEVLNKIRAFVSEGGAYTFFRNQRIKIFKAEIVPSSSVTTPGTVLESSGKLVIACRKGAVSIKELQREGRKRQPVQEFVRGFRIRDDVFK